jgi:signal transduction histidine kinase
MRADGSSEPATDGHRVAAVLLCLLVTILLALGGPFTKPVAAQPVQPAESAASDERGYPPFRNYTPADYGQAYGRTVQSQNWSVTQDGRGVIYVANPNGVLTFDGVEWRLIPTERQTLVRTVVTDTSGTVYVGASSEIGKLEPDSTGTLRYVSLLDTLDTRFQDFGDTWSGAAGSDGVFFQARRMLFRWDGRTVQHWRAPDSTSYSRVFAVRDSIFVHEDGAGLRKYVGGDWQLVPGSQQFADDVIRAALPVSSGLLVGTEAGELYRYQAGEFIPFEAEAQPYLADHALYDGAELPNGAFAFATLRGGVLITDRQGQTLHVLDKRSGLVDNDVKSLFVDRQGGLWMACGSGLSRVDVLSSLSFYDERAGLEGDGLSIARHDGAIYAGTSAGVYRLRFEDGPGGAVEPRFQLVRGLRAQVFDLFSTSAGLLAASDKGVYALQAGALRRVGSGRTAFGLHVSRRDSTVAYVGYIDGVGTLRRSNGQWTDGTRLSGFNKEIHYLEEDGAGGLWVASTYGGLWRVEVTDGLQGNLIAESHASEENNLQHRFRMAHLDQHLHIITQQGIARPVVSDAGQVTLQQDSTIHNQLPANTTLRDLVSAPDGDVWGLTNQAIYWLDRQSDGSFDVSAPITQLSEPNTPDPTAEADGVLWLAGKEGVVRHRPRRTRAPTPPIRTLVRRVATVESDSLIFGGDAVGGAPSLPGGEQDAQAEQPVHRLTYDHNALRFEFAAPSFGNSGNIEYQHRLTGFTDEWSPWTDESSKEYTNLSSGEYEFQVRARNPHAWESSIASFSFEVLSPWYRTTWAYAIFGALIVLFLASAVWWRSAHLEARARNLERTVAQRTEEVQEQAKQLASYNRELRQTNEVLQETLEQKSELLGIAAHDLKNPLFGIRGLSEILLENKEMDESMQRKLNLIYESADETLELINDLLESAAASSGQVRLDMEVVDMGPVAEWVVHSFRQQAEKKGQRINFKPSERDCRIKADERKLREAMSNLVSNAVKYSPKGAQIDVSVHRTEEEVNFLVKDEGPGLSEEERKNLFAPFQRLSPEPTAGEASSGLGLYIVKQLIELHDGEVWVESEKGTGSTFGITIPAVWPVAEEQPAVKAGSN